MSFLVATVARWDEHARMLVIHEQKCQELSQTIKYTTEQQEKLLDVQERRKSLLKEASQEFSKQIFQEITKLQERLSEDEMNCWTSSRVWKEWARTRGTSK